jgi:hypothetical protein
LGFFQPLRTKESTFWIADLTELSFGIVVGLARFLTLFFP